MFHHFLICSLLAHVIWALPAPAPVPQLQHPVGDIASHIVIVTPQAQVHLEPVLKYDSPSFIQHLTPLARFASPHEETIVYYPASAAAAAPLVPVETASIARADAIPATKQNYIEQIQTAIQTGAAMYGPQLSEAAASAAAAAASAGSSFFPGSFFPTNAAAAGTNLEKEPQTQGQLKSEEKKLAVTQPLISDGRRFYALAPAGGLPHIIDFVHTPQAGPVLVSPVQVIRARSIDNPELPIVALPIPEALKPEALPLNKKKTELKENKETKKIEAEKEKEKIKSNEFGRFLEANALREQQADEAPKQQQQQSLKEEISKPDQPLAADSAIIAEPTAQTLLKDGTEEIAAAAPQALQAEAIANDALPAAKIA